MAFIILGFVAFLLFVLYDINSVILKYKLLNSSFFVGFMLLIISTIGIVVSTQNQKQLNDLNLNVNIFGIIAFLFLLLLIYTLFWALPFKDTYTSAGSTAKVCQRGVYALCRHPGVLWFIGFYFFFWLAMPVPLLLVACITFSFLNILYVIFQDKWTFMMTFENYDEYKKTTPFLLPTMGSIKKCMETLR